MEKIFSATDEYPDLENHHSHMAHCLTEELYRRMRELETTSGFTIDDAIQPGVDQPGDPYRMAVGCVAGDEESYEVFKEFFDQVIEAKHNGYKMIDHPKPNVDVDQANGNCFDTAFVTCCRVRSVRNLKGFCLSSHCTRAERREIESIVKNVCQKLPGEFKGEYTQAKDLPDADPRFIDIKTEISDAQLLPLCMQRDWPDARGLFVTENDEFLVQVNGTDHVRCIASRKDGDLKLAFSRCYQGLQVIEKCLNENGFQFMQNATHGYISTCPGNLGTGMKASVRMRIPKLLKHFRIEELLRRLRLKKEQSWIDGKLSDSLVDISNLDTVGITETDTIQNLLDGIKYVIESEKKLENEQNIDTKINQIKRKKKL